MKTAVTIPVDLKHTIFSFQGHHFNIKERKLFFIIIIFRDDRDNINSTGRQKKSVD